MPTSEIGVFMPDMGPYMAEKYTKMIEGITTTWAARLTSWPSPRTFSVR